jgi:uncharacterized protein YukE
MKTNIFSEKKVLNILKTLNEQADDEYYRISPEEYLELMRLASYNGPGLSKIKTFQKKPLYITGKLTISNTPTESLGNVAYIDGTLDISRTNILSLGNTIVNGHIWDHGTPRERKRIETEMASELEELKEKELNNERDINNPNIDKEGLMANALMEFISENYRKTDIEVLSDEDKDRVNSINKVIQLLTKKIEKLTKRYNETGDESVQEEIDKLEEELENFKDELEEITDDKIGLYDLYLESRGYYGNLSIFKIPRYEFKDYEFTVGTEGEMEEAALEYAKNYIDDIGLDGFNRGFIDDYIDNDQVEQVAREFYEDNIRDNPESYFDDDDFQLTDEQEKRIQQLEKYIEDMKTLESELEDELGDLEDSDSDEYNDLEEKLEEISNNIDTAQEELDSIEIDKEPTEDMIEEKLNRIIRNDVLYDPADWLRDHGYEIKYYVNEDELAQGLIDSDGWGIMNGYDSDYSGPYYYGNERFYVMMVNK